MRPDFLATVSGIHGTGWGKNEALGSLDPGDVPSWLIAALVEASLLQTKMSANIW